MDLQVKLNRFKETDNKIKLVCETYIINADSFSFAEKIVMREVSNSAIVGNVPEILSIKKVKIDDIKLNEDCDIFYLAKVNMLVIDENTGKEKKSPIKLLIQSTSVENANKVVNDMLKYSSNDWVIESIKETPIVDYLLPF